MIRRFTRQIAIAAAGLALLLVSLALLSYARWVREVAEGNRAMANEDYAEAERTYADAAGRAERSVLPFSLLRSPYRRLVFNRARALYAARKGDDLLLHMLEAEASRIPSLADDSEYHFWIGAVQYRKAISQNDKQAVRAGLQRAADSFRRALAAAPDDWDAKYNYEITARRLESMRKNEDKVEKLKRGEMKILREDTDKAKERQQKLSPEKQS
jgi:hypothetical protein